MFFERIEKKYGSAKTLEERLEAKYKCKKNHESEKIVVEKTNVFECDEEYNRRSIKKLIETFELLLAQCESHEIEEAARKVLETYKKNICRLLENKDIEDGEKIAKKFGRYLKSMLAKLWTYRDFSLILREYMEKNDIILEEYKQGDIMTDDKIMFLNSNYIELYMKTPEDEKQSNHIIKMIQPVVYIYYKDSEEEKECEVIEGICEFFGRFERTDQL